MPDLPNPKAREHPGKNRGGSPEDRGLDNRPRGGCAYAELQAVSNFSFLRGASHPDELVARAAEVGCCAVAVTDVNTLAGIVRAHEAAKEAGIQLVVGCRLEFTEEGSGGVAEWQSDRVEKGEGSGLSTVLVYPTDRAAYGRLCRLLTRGKRRAEKGECRLSLHDLVEFQEGLLAVVVPPDERGGPEGERFLEGLEGLRRVFDDDRLSLASSCLYGADDAERLALLAELARPVKVPLVATNDVHYHVPGRRALQDVLTCIRHGCRIQEAGLRLWAHGERYVKGPEEMARLFALQRGAIARTVEVARRASGFSLDQLKYEYPEEVCPRGRSAKEYLRELVWAGAAEKYRKPREERLLGASSPRNTAGAAGTTKGDAIAQREAAAAAAHPPGLERPCHAVPAAVADRLEHELTLIGELGYEKYFLTVHDIVHFARSQNILCQGRGAAANSAVCYCLGITSVDPDRIDLLFERFVSKERDEPPDIDIDFEHERREEVIQHIYRRFGRDRAALCAEVITYRGRSAVRDVGKAMGLSLDVVDRMAKELDWWDSGAVAEERIREMGLDPGDATIRMVLALTAELLGFPRHLSQHVGGFVITQGLLEELVPIENAAMEDRTVIEWDKDDIDAMGMLKIDCLGLGMLTAIRKALDFVNGKERIHHRDTETQRRAEEEQGGNEHRGHRGTRGTQRGLEERSEPEGSHEENPTEPREGTGSFLSSSLRTSGSSVTSVFNAFSTELIQLHTVPPEDPAVYEMICHADTVGVFQIESRAQMSMLPRLKPRCYYDLVIEVAIVRPGPIQGDMVHPYLRRRNKEEDWKCPTQEIEQVLGRTMGVPLFQEQAMRLAIVAAGFTAGEADQLRRAMAAWKRKGDRLLKFEDRFVGGMLERGYTEEFARRCFEQLKGFSEYGFPESHAASFALLVYVSSWLKRYHPAAFAAGLINSQPMGFYAPAQLVRDAKEHGVQVRGVDVNFSGWDCRLEQEAKGRQNAEDAERNAEDRRGGRGLTTKAQRSGNRSGVNTEDTEVTEGHRGGRGEEGLGRRRGEEERMDGECAGPDDPVFSSLPSPSVSSDSSATSVLIASDPATWGQHGPAVRLGMRLVKGLGEAHALAIEEAVEKHGAFSSIVGLWRASGVPVKALKALASADAFGSMGLDRRAALWEVRALRDERLPLYEEVEGREDAGVATGGGGHGSAGAEERPRLPVMGPERQVSQDYATTGLSLKAHPLSFHRAALEKMGVRPAAELRDPMRSPAGTKVAVAGIVLVRQRPSTASGIVFMTIEDESGIANLILRPQIYERFRRAAKHSVCVVVRGVVERQGEVVHVMVRRVDDLNRLVADGEALEAMSRDFR
jgi:error-prone DNA polymerase